MSSTNSRLAKQQPAVQGTDGRPATPWWRVGMVWLVLSGPALVVVAGIGTAVIAYRNADEVLTETASARTLPVRPDTMTPAHQARNHAATAK